MREQRAKGTPPPHPPLSKGGRRGGNEKGIALVMILILAAIALAIMAGLIYMITSGTQISGMQKRYKTALDAGYGGADISYGLIALRGETFGTSSFLTDLASLNPSVTTSSSCTGTDLTGTSYSGLAAKLNTPATSWSAACDADNMSITTTTVTSYDMRLDLGSSPYPTYRVYSKIVDAVEGNSGGDEGLLAKGVVSGSTGEVTVMSRPYLYTIEVDAENLSNPAERAKLSVLYQY